MAGSPRDRRWASKEGQAASAEMAANAEMAAAAIHAAAEEKMGTVPQIAIYINKREKKKIWKRIPGWVTVSCCCGCEVCENKAAMAPASPFSWGLRSFRG